MLESIPVKYLVSSSIKGKTIKVYLIYLLGGLDEILISVG